jgi:NSS family neurotransmitter:Na+ symporter
MIRDRWPNNFIFILAAVGSAVGLGNLWRFPFMAYSYGGAAFVVVCGVAYVLVGYPLLTLEIALGQRYQKGAPGSMEQAAPRWGWVGIWAVICGASLLSYYAVVMGWGIDYLGASFTLAWGENTESFFLDTILQVAPGLRGIGSFSPWVMLGLAVAWVFIFFCIFQGVRSVSRVVYWTVALPYVLIAILIVRGVTLPGCGEGLRYFLVPEWGKLLDPTIWVAGFSQAFFSLSLAFGIMQAYGSYRPEDAEIPRTAAWIVFGDFAAAMMGGLAIFSTLGYMAHVQGVAVTEVVKGGPSLAFVVLPKAISLLPALPAVFGVIFFVTIATLAVDSAFSLVEAALTPLRDFLKSRSVRLAVFLCAVGFCCGIVYTSDVGYYVLDIVDHVVVNYSLLLVGIFEAVAVAYVFGAERLREYINERAAFRLGRWWTVSIKIIIPFFLSALLVYTLYIELSQRYGGYSLAALIGIGLVPLLAAPVASVWIRSFARRREALAR